MEDFEPNPLWMRVTRAIPAGSLIILLVPVLILVAQDLTRTPLWWPVLAYTAVLIAALWIFVLATARLPSGFRIEESGFDLEYRGHIRLKPLKVPWSGVTKVWRRKIDRVDSWLVDLSVPYLGKFARIELGPSQWAKVEPHVRPELVSSIK